jgi:drug/metabolite transporter (DMT)-like permease
MRAMGAAEWAMVLALSVLWGGSFFFVGVAVAELPPLTIVALRVGLAALALNLAVLASGRRMPGGARTWATFLAMGVLNNVIPFSLIVWGQTQIASGLASILNATTPLFTVLIAHALTRDERMSAGRLGGAIVGFAGVAVMIGPDALRGLGADVLAQLAILGASLSYAFAGVFGRRFAHEGVAPLIAASGQVTASALVLAPLALAVETPWTLPLPEAEVWGAVVGLALLSTALAYLLYFRILARVGATNLLVVTFLIPVSAIALGGTVLGERLTPLHFAGLALIGLGLALIDGRLSRGRAAAHQERPGGEGT